MDETTYDPDSAAVLEQYGKAIAGLKSEEWPANQQVIVFEQETYTPAELAAKLTQDAAPLQAVEDAWSALRTALTNRHAAFAGAVKTLNAFYGILPHYLPPGTDTTTYGAKPRKARTPLTAEQKVEANQKRQATRKARFITGKKQRKAIKAPAPTT
jgi:hypothetical protein